jgi:hypothetical protein
MSDTKASNQMWGGRFASGPDAIMEAINASIGFDRKLYAQDIRGSIAHARMLAETGIISADDQEKIVHGLNTILSEIEDGRFEFSTRLEDIHMNVEARLAELIGPAAGRLHTARSRNDQVATDFRLWVKEELQRTEAALVALIEAFLGPRRRACGDRDAGLHPSADGAARDLRPSLHGLCGDVFARSVAGARRDRAHGRKPAGRGRARRHRLSDRPAP